MENILSLKLNLLHIACIFAIFQALLMAVVLFSSKKGNKLSNRILGFWLLSFTILMGSSFLLSYGISGYFMNYHKLIFVMNKFSLLIAPLFYFYILSLLDENFRFRKKDLVHSLPLIVTISYSLVSFISIRNFIIWKSFLRVFSNGFFLLQNLFYYILVLQLLKSHEISIETFFLDKMDLKYNWIRFLIIGSFVIWIAKLQIFIFGFISAGGKWCAYTATTYFMVLFLFVTLMVYVYLKTPILFLFNKKYAKSSLSKKNKDKLKKQLLKYMNDEKLYLDSTLSLDMLAKELSVLPKYLSQVINEMFNQNFNDFINQYRVQECIKRLQDQNNGHKTLLQIAFECGFNTKATFNSVFKKFTGATPKEFRKKSKKS
jgi:AraC-like DNA-binding protein